MALFSKLRIPSHVRLFLIFLITFIIPFSVLTIVFVQSYRDIYREQVTQSCKYEMDSVATLIDTQFQTSARHIAMLTQDETLVSHLRASVHPDYEVPEDTPSLQEMVRDYIVATPSMLNTKVVVLSKNNDVLLGSEYIGNLHTNAEFQEMIQSSYRSPLKSTIWFSDQHFSKSDVNDSYIFVTRPVTDPSNWQVLGYVLLRFRNSDIISMYLNNTEPYRSVFVTDSHGEIISLVDNLKTKNYVQESYVQLLLSSEPFVVGNYLAYTVKLNNLWYVVSMTEIDAVARTELTSSLAFYIFALLVCAVITLCVSYLLSKHFMRPIKILTDRMHEVEEGDLHSRANIQTHDEFEDLANSYNKMIQRIEVLMRQIIFEQEQKRKADIHLLQAQINPHFLYNTLASIRYMVHTSPPAETDKILLALGRFLKYVLSNREDVYVTIDHELEQLDNYITIQGVGFDADLQYRVTVEKGLGHYMVVKMLLQPLVENALLHGLKLNKKDPLLHIDIASASNDMLQIKIIDNGTGFDVTSLSQKPSDDLPHHHLGISNVQQRLLLHYGESFKFDIQSTKGVGTTISIQIPKLTAEEIDNESVNR